MSKAKTGQVAPHGSKSNGNLEMDENVDENVKILKWKDWTLMTLRQQLNMQVCRPQMSLRGSWSWVHGNSPTCEFSGFRSQLVQNLPLKAANEPSSDIGACRLSVQKE